MARQLGMSPYALRQKNVLLRGERVTHEGRWYAVEDAQILPPGPRAGGPPILIAGKQPRMLRLVAEHADLWNAAWYGLPETAGELDERVHAVRAALDAAGRDPATRLSLVGPALRDPVMGVRQEAARALASVPDSALTGDVRAAFEAAAAAVLAGLDADADRPWALLDRAAFLAARGDLPSAERSARAAIRIEPLEAQSWVALAEIQLLAGRDEDAERTLRRGGTVVEGAADLEHALGLLLVRRGRLDEAVEPLGRAARLRPDIPRYLYAYAVALRETGQTGPALEVAVPPSAVVGRPGQSVGRVLTAGCAGRRAGCRRG